jgi:DNA-binding transcriptional regulator YiaG
VAFPLPNTTPALWLQEAKMVGQLYTRQQVEHLIQLVKKGDPASLAQLRRELGRTQKEVAAKIGISEYQLGRWERGEQQPTGKYYTQWKLRLSDYVDNVIAVLLGTEDGNVITQFWELMWGLID